MLESKFYQYDVVIASDEFMFFDGRFKNREDAVLFIKHYLNDNPYLPITDICCTKIGTETDLMNVNNI